MGYYLFDNPPRRRQGRPRRAYNGRTGPSGVVVVHTAEGVMDTVGMDTGAENVAGFISRRGDAGSYHELVDSDSHVSLLPDDWEAFHVAADGHNRHAWGISAACRTVDWDPAHWWTERTIRRMGERIAAFWQRLGLDPLVCARWISRDEALAGTPGLVCHGTLQPADRSDAWVRSGHRSALEQALVESIRRAAAPPAVRKEDDVYYLYKLHPDAVGEGEPGEWLVTPGGEKFGDDSGLSASIPADRLVRIDLSLEPRQSATFRNGHP